MPAGVGDEETAPFLTESPPSSPTSIITIPYQPLDHGDSINGDDSSSSRSHGSEWTMSQSARRLYVSHTLSTWNSRVFEFGSVLYLASIFPGTLMPLAIYSMLRAAAAITLSSWVGNYIDRNDRLKTVRFSIGMLFILFRVSSLTLIVSQRLVVAVSCVIFIVLIKVQDLSRELKIGLLVASILMACVEKLAAIMNLVSVERDWVSDYGTKEIEWLTVNRSSL